jgi:hypothetical protein
MICSEQAVHRRDAQRWERHESERRDDARRHHGARPDEQVRIAVHGRDEAGEIAESGHDRGMHVS